MSRKDTIERRKYDNEWKKAKRHGLNGDDIRKYHKEYMKGWRKKNIEKEKIYQQNSSIKRKKYHKKYYQENKERLHEQKQKYYLNNKSYFKQKSNEHYLKNKERKQNEWRAKRLEVIKAYGGRCVCCGEDIMEFLALDHVNNDGKEHRLNIRINVMDWAIRNNFPKNLQLLCHNCNNAKAFYGGCPHDRIKS